MGILEIKLLNRFLYPQEAGIWTKTFHLQASI